MALELVKLDSATLPGIADAIRGKTGATELLLPSQMAAAIASIPTGGELPELTRPAEVGHVVAGKEYIDAGGNKQTGTMVVCDSLEEVEHFGEDGTGVHFEIQSSVDDSFKTFTLPEANLTGGNIKSGVSIFGIAGNAKTLRVETGTITPAEDTQAITIPNAGNVLDIVGVSVPAATGYVIASSYSKGNHTIDAQMGGYFRYASPTSIISAGIGVSVQDGKTIVNTGNAARIFAAGVTYQWTVYKWGDA